MKEKQMNEQINKHTVFFLRTSSGCMIFSNMNWGSGESEGVFPEIQDVIHFREASLSLGH